jgi:hypothetical protein
MGAHRRYRVEADAGARREPDGALATDEREVFDRNAAPAPAVWWKRGSAYAGERTLVRPVALRDDL